MAGNTFGTLFRITTWGESHGPALGVVIDGCPAGLELDVALIQAQLDRRRVGQSRMTSARREPDEVEVLAGVFEGRTTGTPLSLLIRNTNAKSNDYDNLLDLYRPGHADYTYDAKYGFRDHRGGGRSSARETAARVAAGAVARQILAQLGISLVAYTLSMAHLLALTSFNRAIKSMGATRWQMLHRAVYAVALLGLLHFFWMRAAKSNFNEVAIYAVVIALLLGWRLARRFKVGRQGQPA